MICIGGLYMNRVCKSILLIIVFVGCFGVLALLKYVFGEALSIWLEIASGVLAIIADIVSWKKKK